MRPEGELPHLPAHDGGALTRGAGLPNRDANGGGSRRDHDLQLKPCAPVRSAKEAIDVALQRFHESWHRYRSITPTLYLIADVVPGRYVTLGRLRRGRPLDRGLVDRLAAAAATRLPQDRPVEGYLLALEGVGGDPLRPLFVLEGHHHGEPQHGAMDLGTYAPFEGRYLTELDLADRWPERRMEAFSNANLLS